MEKARVGAITAIVTIGLSALTTFAIMAMSYERNVMTLEVTVEKIEKMEPKTDKNTSDIAELKYEIKSLESLLRRK